MKLRHLEDLGSVEGKNVLVRSDLNVPITDGEIQDDFRIRQSLPTWEWLVERKANVTVCAHLGRPKGQPNPRYSIEPVRARVAQLMPQVKVLENLRYSPGEEANDPAFVQELIAGQDIYVDDAFGAAHRAHASIVGPPQFLPSAAGILLAREVEKLGMLLEKPPRPFVAVLGGAKVSDKIGVIDTLLRKVDTMVIGGGMSYTFLKALGHDIGDSLLQEDQLDYCRRLLDGDKRIVLPVDLVVANPEGEVQIVKRDVPEGWEGFDAGPETRELFAQEILHASTVFWNGPVGRFEDKRFAEGTRAVAEAMAKTGGTSVIGGGDVVSAVNGFGLASRMDWVSTGGGAALEFIELGDLPGAQGLAKVSLVTEARRPLISGNWKMNLNHFEAISTIQKLYWALKPEDYRSVEVSVHPPFTDLRSVQTVLEADSVPIALGAQNCYSEDAGAFTGEVSASMLVKMNVAYVLAGHSERRALFGETNELVAAKAAAVLRNGMVPIVCVGETMAEREAGRAEEVVTTQLTESVAKLKPSEAERIVVAYEPVWAIGTGATATANDAQIFCKLLRSLLTERFGVEAGARIRIQYGGSVKAGNARELLVQSDVDGLLVGGASLDPAEFARIVAAAHVE